MFDIQLEKGYIYCWQHQSNKMDCNLVDCNPVDCNPTECCPTIATDYNPTDCYPIDCCLSPTDCYQAVSGRGERIQEEEDTVHDIHERSPAIVDKCHGAERWECAK